MESFAETKGQGRRVLQTRTGCARGVGVLLGLALMVLIAPSQQGLAQVMPWSEDLRSQLLADLHFHAAGQLLDSVLADLPIYQVALRVRSETSFTGSTGVLYTNRSSEVLHEIPLRVIPNVMGGHAMICSASIGTEPVQCKADENDPSIVWFPLRTPLGPSQKELLEFDFEVTLPTANSIVDRRFSSVIGLLNAAWTIPTVARRDESGWDLRPGGELGEPYWGELGLYLVEFDIPQGYKIFASGIEQRDARRTLGDTETRRFIAGPIEDFFWAGSYRWDVIVESAGAVQLACHAFGGESRKAAAFVYYAKQAILTLSERLCAYPRRHLDLLMEPGFVSGVAGVMHPGVVAVYSVVFDQPHWGNLGMLPFEHSMEAEAVVVHEIAHQWVGEYASSDPVEEPWLGTMLAQLATWLYFGERYGIMGHGGFEASLEEGVKWLEASLGISIAPHTPPSLYLDDNSAHGGVAHYLAPLVLWNSVESQQPADAPLGELRREMWSLLAAFVVQNAWSDFTSEDFLRFLEEAVGDAARQSFEAWLSP